MILLGEKALLDADCKGLMVPCDNHKFECSSGLKWIVDSAVKRNEKTNYREQNVD